MFTKRGAENKEFDLTDPIRFELDDDEDYQFDEELEFKESENLSVNDIPDHFVTALQKQDELGMRAFNDLFHQLKEKVKDHKVAEGKLDIKEDKNLNQLDLDYFVIERNFASPEKKEAEKRRIVFFNLMKDADTAGNEELLPSVSSVLSVFQTENVHIASEKEPESILYNLMTAASTVLTSCHLISPKKTTKRDDAEHQQAIKFLCEEKAKNSIFIFPVRQCRGFFYNRNPFSDLPVFKAAHIVLAVYDSGRNKLEVHDSRGGICLQNPFTQKLQIFSIPYVYPDKFKELPNLGYDGVKSHKLQMNEHMCGYYVHVWMTLIATTANLDLIKRVFLRPFMIKSQEHYLKNWSEITTNIVNQLSLPNKNYHSAGPTMFAHVASEDASAAAASISLAL